MIQVQDQLGRMVVLNKPARRIISLVPSQTELLFYLGLDQQIIGLTKFCVHPSQKVKEVTKVGGTKQIDLDLIRSLAPDLIIANKEENDRLQIEQLPAEFPVYISDPHDLPSALQMIGDIGSLTGRAPQADQLCNDITLAFSNVYPLSPRPQVLYLIWRKPYMAAGKGTFIDAMLNVCGLENVLSAERYPELKLDNIADLKPEMILLSSEPYPFGEKHKAEIAAKLPDARIELVDGEMFSWYGSRLLKAAEYFISLTDRLKQV